MKRLISLASVIVLVGATRAGEGGCSPDSGYYKFEKTDPPPTETVGVGYFDGAGGATVLVGNDTTTWKHDDADGQFHRTDAPAPGVTFCVQDGEPLTYQYKYEGVPISGGNLIGI